MSYTVIPERWACNSCGTSNMKGASKCTGCGVPFTMVGMIEKSRESKSNSYQLKAASIHDQVIYPK